MTLHSEKVFFKTPIKQGVWRAKKSVQSIVEKFCKTRPPILLSGRCEWLCKFVFEVAKNRERIEAN